MPRRGQGGKIRRDESLDTSKPTGLQVPIGDNRKYIQHNMQLAELAAGGIDLTDPEQVAERITKYFTLCAENDIKPGIASFALAFDVERQAVRKWANGRVKSIPPEVQKLFKRAFVLLNAQMEDYMMNGNINPVSGIFLLKNHYNYEDKTQVEVAQKETFDDETDPAELRRKYLDSIEIPTLEEVKTLTEEAGRLESQKNQIAES